MKDTCENCGDAEELFCHNGKRLCRICRHDAQQPTEDDLKTQSVEQNLDSQNWK